MGRTRRVETSPATTSMVASAVALVGDTGGSNSTTAQNMRAAGQPWQSEAWELYHNIGEYRFSCDWVGSMLSKAILFAQIDKDGKPVRLPSGNAFEYVNTLFGNSQGRADMLRNIGIHLTVTGECFLIGQDKVSGGIDTEHWQVAAISRLQKYATDKWVLDGMELEGDPYIVRLWRPDPEHPEYAISPTRSALPILREIWKLTQHVTAQVNSRLAGAGIFLVPSEMTFPSPPEVPEGGKVVKVNDADSLMKILHRAMSASIADRGNASALVPIVITAPGDTIDKVQHMTFWSELDAQAMELRNEAIRRLALSMDMPPEVLQGSGESNHWSAWQADEAAIKSHTEPLLNLIANSISAGYLRPILKTALDQNLGEPGGDIDLISIGVDTSEMRLRPNRSKEALELYDRGALSPKALLRETGFDDEDIMDDKERVMWLMMKVASGSTTPELVAAALAALGVNLTPAAPTVAPDEDTTEGRPTPSLVEHPVQDIPDQQRSISRKEARTEGRVLPPGMVAAAEQTVFRALERSGNRLKNRIDPKLFSGMDAFSMHTALEVKESDTTALLSDAWGHNVDALAESFGMDREPVAEALDTYVRTLFKTRTKHNRDAFSAFLSMKFSERLAA